MWYVWLASQINCWVEYDNQYAKVIQCFGCLTIAQEAGQVNRDGVWAKGLGLKKDNFMQIFTEQAIFQVPFHCRHSQSMPMNQQTWILNCTKTFEVQELAQKLENWSAIPQAGYCSWICILYSVWHICHCPSNFWDESFWSMFNMFDHFSSRLGPTVRRC